MRMSLRLVCIAAACGTTQSFLSKLNAQHDHHPSAFIAAPTAALARSRTRGKQQSGATPDITARRLCSDVARARAFGGYNPVRDGRGGNSGGGSSGCRMSTMTPQNGQAVGVRTEEGPPEFHVDSPAAAGLVAQGIESPEWESLLRAGEVLSLKEGELLMSEGDSYDNPGDREVYLMLSGVCRLAVQESPVAMISAGDFVGEASFTSGRLAPRTATVRATEGGARVVSWTWDALKEFMDDPAHLNAKVALQGCWMKGLAGRLNDLMSALGGQSVVDADDQKVEAGDYGFRYLEDSEEVETIVPVSAISLAWWTFTREYRSLRRTFRFGEFRNTWISGPFALIDRFLETSIFPTLRPSRVDLPRDPEVKKLQKRLRELKLSNKAIEDREIVRIAATQELLEEEARKGNREAGMILRSQTPWFVMMPYRMLCWFLDVIFEDRPIQRFWFLETVARMPYFSYLSMLFFYESLGWWSGGAEVRKVHFAEEYNEMQHLRIMESLGGDTRWSDRFLARHAAIMYFWVLTLGYLVSPFLAYNFSELIESHAVDTYTEFAEANKELLQSLPPTPQALAYYQGGDMYLFDEFQTSRPAFSRRPTIKNLYDIFTVIRDDELEHVKTMFACERGQGGLTSPNAAAATPRWAEDALSPTASPEEEEARKRKRRVTGGEFENLRSDIVRKPFQQALYATFKPLTEALDEFAAPSPTEEEQDHMIRDHQESVNERHEIQMEGIQSGADNEGRDPGEAGKSLAGQVTNGRLTPLATDGDE